MRWLGALLMLVLAVPTAHARDLSRLYSQDTLEQARPDLERTTRNIAHALWNEYLLSEEKRPLGEPPPLEVPLYAEKEKGREHPLNFFADYTHHRIVAPVLALKFLDDLCTAYAWLQHHGYGVETISEYTAILAYGEEPSEGFPSPLEALGIPANARSDPQVEERAIEHSVTARMFILLHEMGHLLQQRSEQVFPPRPSLEQEKEADRFAIQVMQRAAMPPIGMIIHFMATAHIAPGDPAPGEQRSHPSVGARVLALADAVDDPELKALFTNLGRCDERPGDTCLDDPDIREGILLTGRHGALSALAPRRLGELPRLQGPPAEVSPGTAFHGIYRGEFVRENETTAIPYVMLLTRRGGEVTGQYNFGLGQGSIEGTVEGDRLFLRWMWGSAYGKGVLKSETADSFSGTWGIESQEDGAGVWTGRRVR